MEDCYLGKPATLLKVTLFHSCFSQFLNYANGTKCRKPSQISINAVYTYLIHKDLQLKYGSETYLGPGQRSMMEFLQK